MNIYAQMVTVIVTTLTSSIITGVISYLSGKIKAYQDSNTKQEEALLCLLRSNITSKYYIYTELGSIPLYEKENIDYMAEQYKSMGGNSYVEQLVKEVNKLPIKK